MNEIVIENDKGQQMAKYTADMVQTIKDTVAQKATDSELKMFLTVASMYNLNPFKKEIWFTKFKNRRTGEWVTDIMTSRDGYVKIAKQKAGFMKLQSNAVYENDEFSMEWSGMDVKSIHHTHSASERGKIVGAWAGIRSRTDGDIYVYVPFAEYNKKNEFWSYSSAMIRKVAEKEVCRLYADVSGLHIPEEMTSDQFNKPVGELKNNDYDVEEVININTIQEIEKDDVSDDDVYYTRMDSNVNEEIVMEDNVETFEELIKRYRDILDGKGLECTRIRILKCLNGSDLSVDFKLAFAEYVQKNYDKNMISNCDYRKHTFAGA